MSQVINNVERSRFELEENGLVSIAEYRLRPGVIVITHVIVPEELRGRGEATRLAVEVVQHARREGLKVRPLCPFMAAYFKRHKEAEDVLEPSS